LVKETGKNRISWHPAFCSAAEFDLRKYKEYLSFDREHNLSKEPLRIDLLIIKKETEAEIESDIAEIFRKYNIIEYKSPDDILNIDTYYKILGYACLYKGLADETNKIPSSEITVSLFREVYPVKLIKSLEEEGLSVLHPAPGIYVIEESKPFPVQIVVTGELNPRKYPGLRILSKNAGKNDIENFLLQAEKETEQGMLLNIDSILQVCVAANIKTFDELKRREPIMCEALRELMKDEINEARINGINEGIKEGINKGIKEGIKEGINKGIQQEKYNIARSMLKNNIVPELVSSVTGISIPEVKKLISETVQ